VTPKERTPEPTGDGSATATRETSTPGGETASPTDDAGQTLTPTLPAQATVQPASLDLVLDTGCGNTYSTSDRANVIVSGVVTRTVQVHVSRFPGAVHVATLTLEPSGPPIQIPYAFTGPSGRQRLVAEVVDEEGLQSSCEFDIGAVPTREPTPTRVTGGFVAQPTPDPGLFLPLAAKHGLPKGPSDVAAPSADAAEIDVAWVSRLPHPRYVASALGNGANYRLSVYRLESLGQPTWVSDGTIMPGFDVRVHRLSSGSGGIDGIDRLLVSAARRSGQLWLTSWSVSDGGALVKLDTHGYGPRDVTVEAYSIASRVVPGNNGGITRYQVVTPVRTGADQARVLSWSVDPDTGALNGTDDTGDWQAINPTSDLGITYLPDAEVFLNPDLGFENGETYDNDRLYAMTFQTAGGTLGQWILQVLDSGGVGWFGGGESGVTVRNNGVVAYDATTARVVPVGRSGFISVRRDGASDPDVLTWDYRSATGASGLVPHRLGRSDWDTNPDGKGVSLAQDDPLDPSFIGSDIDGERAIASDWLWEQNGAGDGELFVKTALGKPDAGGIASVAKVMTLLVTLEAVQSGDVALDDTVTVPEEGAEGAPAWMQPPLAEGDQVELRTLLHGLMKRSSNGAARSIAYHVAGQKYGAGLSYDERLVEFLDDMNDKASLLLMSDTLYCQPQGSSHSTPQDQVTLWLEVSKKALFWEFAGTNTYDPPCGLDANDDPKCFSDMSKGTMGFPGLNAEKNGLKSVNSGVGYQAGQLSCSAFASDSTFDACRQCRIASAERLGRSFVGASQQSDDSSGDVVDLLEYAVLKRFTADARATAPESAFVPVGENPVDYALAALEAEPSVSALVLANGEVRVCAWNVSAGLGMLSPLACLTKASPHLGPGAPLDLDPSASVEAARVDDLSEAEADVLVANLEGPVVMLRIYRVGPRDPTW
jgi:hypothetical protein